jgi:hypothetical protein
MATVVKTSAGPGNALIRKQGWSTAVKPSAANRNCPAKIRQRMISRLLPDHEQQACPGARNPA